jgi:hypothetical protein
MGVAGLAGAAACICVTLARLPGARLPGELWAAGGGLPVWAAGVVTRGGTAIAGGAALVLVELVLVEDAPADGALAAGGVAGTFGGITTTVGGRYPAATEAGVTILGGGVAGASLADFGGNGLDDAGASFASTAGVATGGLTIGRAAGVSAAPFCCVMARSTSPGREIFERSILVLMPSSSRAARAALAELDDASERPRRCFRTRSAS